MAKRFHSIGDYLGWIHRVHTILERDELITISGLASWMKECITCRYLAGLWETNLIHQLLWTLWTENVRLSTFQAPSKSWASTVGPVLLGLIALQSNWKEYRPVAGILHVSVTTTGGTEMGFVIDGYVRLKSRIIPGFFITYLDILRGPKFK
jgi:hypothetical protein